MINNKTIKKISFNGIVFNNFVESDFKNFIKKKGLFLFPSGPGLSNLNKKKKYLKALKNADFNFLDSGFFVILLNYIKNIKVNKFSGYKFLKIYLKFLQKNKAIKIFCIDPDFNSSKINKNFFIKMGVKKSRINNYVAPLYNKNYLSDALLLNKIKEIKPNHILINLGGDTQEILGLYIKNKVNFKCNIFCIGAAIAFFTRKQAPINNFIDNNYFGWLMRIIFNPIIFLPRYLKSFNLFLLILRNNIKILK